MDDPIRAMIKTLCKLPSIGEKTARRLAFFILKSPPEYADELITNIKKLREKVRFCSVCFNLTESDPCSICRDPSRDCGIICVVEEPQDISVIEKGGEFKGRYHVLHGALSPLHGITGDDIKVRELIERVEKGGIVEVILATNTDAEGESTAVYIAQALRGKGVKVTRIACGIPAGSEIEYTDSVTLNRALKNRREF